MLKKVILMTVLGMMSGLLTADLPKPLVDVPLNEGDFAAIKDYAGGAGYVKVHNQNLLKWTDGPSGKALHFQNDQKVRQGKRGAIFIQTPAALDITKGFTIAVTIKPDVLPKSARQQILRFCDSPDRAAGVLLFTYWESFYARLGSAPGKAVDIASKRAVIPARGGKWYKLVITFDGKTGKLYIDGVKQGEAPAAITAPKSRNALIIGSTGDGSGYGFSGIICDFKLYGRALTEAEIGLIQQQDAE